MVRFDRKVSISNFNHASAKDSITSGARHRAIIAGELHGGELSISSFILARLRGVPLRALPVFLSRRFRLRCMYCRVDSTVNHPSELAGKSVTVHRYNATTPVWLRGILQNEFGVKPGDLDWYVAEPDIAEESLKPPPPEVRVHFITPAAYSRTCGGNGRRRENRGGSGALSSPR